MADDLKVIHDIFLSKFDGKLFCIDTPYVPLSSFYIKFDILQLPHLLGLHKIYTTSSPSKIIANLNNHSITYEKIKRHGQFKNVKDRLTCCDFLMDIFIFKKCEYFVHIADYDKRNSMRLDIAFTKNGARKKYVLGLRKNSDCVYVPTTFYSVRTSKEEFSRSKRVRIDNIAAVKS